MNCRIAESADNSTLDTLPRILFAVFQTGNRANGGVESITQVIEGMPGSGAVLTQVNTAINQRWLQAKFQVRQLWVPYPPGASFRRADMWTKLLWVISLLINNWRTFWMIRRLSIDVVHCNDPAPFWHVVPGAWVSRTPVVLNLRDTKATTESAQAGRYRRKFRFASVVLVLSKEMAEFYEQLVGSDFLSRRGLSVEAIYSIVDFRSMRPATKDEKIAMRRSLGIAPENFLLGFIAAFNDKKNQLEFIQRACSMICDGLPAATICFVGDFRPEEDEYARQCRDRVTSLGIEDRVFFAGYTTSVADWYKVMDLVLVPTRKEGLARCMIESMACGVPVVSFDVCSAKEILIGNRCGEVVTQGDYFALATATVKLAKSRETYTTMSRNAADAARKLFDANSVVKQYIDCYRRANRRDRFHSIQKVKL